MSSLALGNPVVAYAYKYDAKGSAFNKLFYNILSPGIYNGGGLSFSGNQIIVDAYDALFPYASSSQLIATHTNSAINLSTSVGLGGYGLGNITSSLPYIAMYFIWTDSEGVYPDYGFYDSSVTTNASYLVLGKATFSGSNVNGFDYSVATYPPRYNPTTKGLNVRGLTESTSTSTGSVVINGGVGIAKSLQVGTAVTSPLVYAGDSLIGGQSIELAGNRTGDGATFIDFHSRSGTDFEARIIRDSGINGTLEIVNTGTGNINISNPAGVILASAVNFQVSSGGNTLYLTGNQVLASVSNLHLDAGTGLSTYINYYGGNGGVRFGDGASHQVASIDAGGNFVGNKIYAAEGAGTAGGYTFVGDGGADTGMFSPSDGVIDFYNNAVKTVHITASEFTVSTPIYGNITGNAATASGTAFMGESRSASAENGVATEWDGTRQYIHGWTRGTTNNYSGSETRVNYADNADKLDGCNTSTTAVSGTIPVYNGSALLVGDITGGVPNHAYYSTSGNSAAALYNAIINKFGDVTFTRIIVGGMGYGSKTYIFCRMSHTQEVSQINLYGYNITNSGYAEIHITPSDASVIQGNVAFF